MKLMVIGDVVGESGMKVLRERLPDIKKQEQIDGIIINGENSAEGMGITENAFKELLALGANVVTMGNHTWAKKDIFKFIEHKQLVRPANLPKGVPGNEYAIFQIVNRKVAVINLIGRVDMNVLSENPFLKAEELIEEVKEKADILVVDFHAEATAEKIAMSYFLDGKVAIVYGTHTHVQTADEKILEKGTAYITDVGMTGPKKSIIGMEIEASLKRFCTSLPERYKVAGGEGFLNACIFEFGENNQVNRIKRIAE